MKVAKQIVKEKMCSWQASSMNPETVMAMSKHQIIKYFESCNKTNGKKKCVQSKINFLFDKLVAVITLLFIMKLLSQINNFESCNKTNWKEKTCSWQASSMISCRHCERGGLTAKKHMH